ncbi:MAG TPA: protein-export chaperone SecB [Clostridiales bacterium]|nr:protein-export chaperone SecB [Clostridiales bacterium]
MTDIDVTKQPGIRFEFVILNKSEFERKRSILTKNEIGINYKCNSIITPDNKRLESELIAEITEKSGNFKLICSMIGVFTVEDEKANMPLKDFAEMNAAALIFPYLREHISSISVKAGIQVILLPPTNIMALVQKNK